MKVLIFAAGLGTRLKPITESMPKALVPVCGKPLLWHVVEKFKRAGFSDFVINVHHFADQIMEYVAANDSFGVNIAFSDETALLRETGGGIRHAAELLGGNEPFVVHNVDILSDLEIEKFVAVHNGYVAEKQAETGTLATLLVSERNTQRYLLFNSEGNMVGWMNIGTGEVRSPYGDLRQAAGESFDHQQFLEKHNLEKYAFDGAHIISPEVFGLMEDWPDKFSIIDFYIRMCGRYNIKKHIQPQLDMIDVGKLDSLQKAEEMAVKLGLQQVCR